MTILEEIIEHKKTEVSLLRERFALKDFEKGPFFNSATRSLAEFLSKGSGNGIIAEFKRKSPSKGLLNNTSDVVEVTAGYEAWGASGLSVLTDNKFFGGSTDDLIAARINSTIPILRKDFIIDEIQILESKALGADAILIISEALNKKEVKRLAGFARSIGLEVLFEMHSASELVKLDPAVSIAGVNNRDLRSFKVDIGISLSLTQFLPAGIPKISESGISDPENIVTLKRAGYIGFLIGEHFMMDADPVKAFREFAEKI